MAGSVSGRVQSVGKGRIAGMRTTSFQVRTGSEPTVRDITSECSQILRSGEDGLLNVFVPHATAGLAIVETGAGSDEDLLALLADLLPGDRRWRHRHGSPGHGRDHVLPAFIAPSVTVPVSDGRLQLGTWQSICLVDTNVDNAERRVVVSFLAG
jgi:secondary thiamine-phosphate synthase enzyme